MEAKGSQWLEAIYDQLILVKGHQAAGSIRAQNGLMDQISIGNLACVGNLLENHQINSLESSEELFWPILVQ